MAKILLARSTMATVDLITVVMDNTSTITRRNAKIMTEAVQAAHQGQKSNQMPATTSIITKILLQTW